MTTNLDPARRLLFWGVIASVAALGSVSVWLGYTRLNRARRYVPRLYAPMFQRLEPPLNYALSPLWRGVDHDVAVEVNAEGVRDRPWPERPAEGLRVVVLGDSQTFGVSVAFDRTFPRLLEDRLRESGQRASVRVAAVPGWNFEDEAAFLRQHLDRLAPDVVVMLFIPNDLDSAITAGPSHQLMAAKRPFQAFYGATDAWALEGFARARLEQPSLELTTENAFRESGRTPYYESFALLQGAQSALFVRYRDGLAALRRQLASRGSALSVLVGSNAPGGALEDALRRIYEQAGVPHVFLSRWLGDQESYLRRWSNLPGDAHGNERYHALLADVAYGEIRHVRPALPMRPMPVELDAASIERLSAGTRAREASRLARIGPAVAWRQPATLEQVLCAGGDTSQLRVVLRPQHDSGYLRIEPLEPAPGAPAVWVELGGAAGFLEASSDGSAVWARLPQAVRAGSTVEVGVVAGVTEAGVFRDVYPLPAVSLETNAPASLVWNQATPALVRARIEGVEADLWMAREATLPLEPAAGGQTLRLRLESLAPARVHPLRLTARAAGVALGTHTLAGPGVSEWELDLPGQVDSIRISSDRVFVPAELDPKNMDHRPLSVRILGMSFSRDRSASSATSPITFSRTPH